MPDDRRPATGDDMAADRQTRAAAELSDRAAELVDRRYDATKEIYLEERERSARHPDDDDGRDRAG